MSAIAVISFMYNSTYLKCVWLNRMKLNPWNSTMSLFCDPHKCAIKWWPWVMTMLKYNLCDWCSVNQEYGPTYRLLKHSRTSTQKNHSKQHWKPSVKRRHENRFQIATQQKLTDVDQTRSLLFRETPTAITSFNALSRHRLSITSPLASWPLLLTQRIFNKLSPYH